MHGPGQEVYIFTASLQTQTSSGRTAWCTENLAKYWVEDQLGRPVEWREAGHERWENTDDDAYAIVDRVEVKDAVALASHSRTATP